MITQRLNNLWKLTEFPPFVRLIIHVGLFLLMEGEKSSFEIVEELILKYIDEKPTKITLKLDTGRKESEIEIRSEKTKRSFKYPKEISFTSFAEGVLSAYRKVYGRLEVTGAGFREEIYKNDKVSLDLYPTGSVGIFEIFVEYE